LLPEKRFEDLRTGCRMAQVGSFLVLRQNGRLAKVVQDGIVIGQVGLTAFEQNAVAIINDPLDLFHSDRSFRRRKTEPTAPARIMGSERSWPIVAPPQRNPR